MIYLNTGFFRPMLWIVSILFLPIVVVGLVLAILKLNTSGIVACSVILLFCFISLFCIYKHSKTKKYYLLSEDDFLAINYPNAPCRINKSEIIKVEYYKISSIRSWLLLFSYICPQSAFITYKDNGREVCKLIGYPDFEKIRDLCDTHGLDFVIF